MNLNIRLRKIIAIERRIESLCEYDDKKEISKLEIEQDKQINKVQSWLGYDDGVPLDCIYKIEPLVSKELLGSIWYFGNGDWC